MNAPATSRDDKKQPKFGETLDKIPVEPDNDLLSPVLGRRYGGVTIRPGESTFVFDRRKEVVVRLS